MNNRKCSAYTSVQINGIVKLPARLTLNIIPTSKNIFNHKYTLLAKAAYMANLCIYLQLSQPGCRRGSQQHPHEYCSNMITLMQRHRRARNGREGEKFDHRPSLDSSSRLCWFAILSSLLSIVCEARINTFLGTALSQTVQLSPLEAQSEPAVLLLV